MDAYLVNNTAASSNDDMAAYLAAAYGQGNAAMGGLDIDKARWQILDLYLGSFNGV
ncbi:hypothetical protein SEUCBS139899_002883 [Sporothrix eucalyptigena]|uniref:Uncharacterized protein n=1 Tax=Sporothrix eucalyptigena TaxID=1812306 RepID=A0ABP0BXJ8_9PEZI